MPTALDLSGPKTHSVKPRMTKKEKLKMWVGIGLLLLIPINLLIFQDIPNLIAETNNIRTGWLGGPPGDDPFLDSFRLNGFMMIVFTTVPLLITGLILFFSGIYSWKKVKDPKFAIFLSTVLAIILIIILVIIILLTANFVHQAQPYST